MWSGSVFDILLTIWDTFGKLLVAAGGLGMSWGRRGAGERKKKKQCEFQSGPGDALGTLAAALGDL